jgi:hypothetical protein
MYKAGYFPVCVLCPIVHQRVLTLSCLFIEKILINCYFYSFSALQTLGIDHFDQHPAGGDVNKIQLDTFVREAKHGLAKVSATYSDKNV